jgi:N-methylhydantoinase B/oxoprolinase/acetone carboxylase alpha subunit
MTTTGEVYLDPASYEVFYNKLDALLQEGQETIRRLSISAIVREAGEALSAIYLPDTGEAVDISTGILMHFLNVTRVIKYTQRNKYDSPDIGIYDGDQFVNSEAYIGGMHVPDTSMLAPFFYQGELLCWIAAISHTNEVGGIEPGGMCSSATDACHDGIHLPAVKLVERGHIRRDIFEMIKRSVRTPEHMDLELKSRMAGNARVRRRLHELVDEVGVDFFKAATRKLVQDEADFSRAKIKELRPGIYRARTFCDTVGPVGGERIAVMEMDMEITEDGRLILRMPIVSPQQAGFNNCYEPAIEATAAYTLLNMLWYDGRWGSGLMQPVELELAPHSRMSADASQPVGYCTIGIGFGYCAALTDTLSRCFYVSGKEEEVQATAAGAVNSSLISGKDRFGRFGSNLFNHGTASLSGGGRVNEDGIENFHFFNPYRSAADAEGEQTIAPVLHLSSQYFPDHHGYGKHRSGAATLGMAMIHGSEAAYIQTVGAGTYMPTNQGLFGGYPGPCTYTDTLLNTNFYEAVKKGEEAPLGVDSAINISNVLKGDYCQHPACLPTIPAKSGDIWVIPGSSGGGLGDPIERDPELIVADIRNKKATVERASRIYCVSINPNTLKVDRKRTEELRAQKRRERLSLGKPAKDYIKDLVAKRKSRQLPKPALDFLDELTTFSPEFAKQVEDENTLAERELKPLGKVEARKTLLKLTPYVNIVEDKNGRKVAVCSRCGLGYCEASQNFEFYCLIYERDGKEIYPDRLAGSKDWYILREFYCPGCGVQVEVEATPPGNTILPHYSLKI